MGRGRSLLSIVVFVLAAFCAIAAHAQRVIATVPSGGTAGAATPTAIALNPVTNKVYVATRNAGTVQVLDGATHGTTPIALGAVEPFALAVNPLTNRVYVLRGTGDMTVINGADNSTTTVAIPTPTALAVNTVSNRIYVTSSAFGVVTIVDGAALTTTTFATGSTGSTAVAVNAAAGKVYVANATADLTVFTEAGATTQNVTLPAVADGLSVDPVTGTVYAVSSAANLVMVVNGTTHAITPIGATAPRAFVVNPATGRSFVASNSLNNVDVLDGTTGAGSVPVGANPVAMSLNAVTNTVMVANFAANSVTFIDGTTLAPVTVAVGVQPRAVAFNPITQRAYVSNSFAATISIIDTTAYTSQPISTGAVADVKVDPITNRIYVSVPAANQVRVIDGATGAITNVTGITDPRRLAVNPATNRIYATSGTGATVHVINGATLVAATIPGTGQAPVDIAVDTYANRIYVAHGGAGGLDVIDGESLAVTPVAMPAAALFVAVNPNTGRSYVALANGDLAVVFFDLDVFPVTTGVARALAVHTGTDRVYVALQAEASVKVVSGQFLSVDTINVGTLPRDVVVNPLTNKVYVSRNASGDVLVVNGTSRVIEGGFPLAGVLDLAIDPLANKIYASTAANGIFVIDGVTRSAAGTGTTGAFERPRVNPATGRVYAFATASTDTHVLMHTPPVLEQHRVNATLPAGRVTSLASPTVSVTACCPYSPTNPAVQAVFGRHGDRLGAFAALAGTGPYTFTPTLHDGVNYVTFFATDSMAGTSATTSSATVTGDLSMIGPPHIFAFVAIDPPTVLFNQSPNGTFGQPYSRTATPGGGAGGPYTWTALDPLPDGLTFSAAGTISGTPTVSGGFVVRLRVCDVSGGCGTRSVGVLINGTLASGPTITSITAGNAQVTLAFDPPASDGGSAIIEYEVWCGAVTAFGPASPIVIPGLANGTPVSCKVRARNSAGLSIFSPDSVEVTPGFEPVFGSAPPPDGTYQVAYSHTYTATGIPTPTFALTAGAFPPGLLLSAAGLLSGTPTAAGTYTGTVTATNGNPPPGTQAFSITIAQVPQEIAFGGLANRGLGTAPFALTATGGGSGNPVTFASQTTSTCTTSGTNGATVTLLAFGACIIEASQAGDGNHTAAPPVQQTFQITDTTVPTITITSRPNITSVNQAAYSVTGTCSEDGRPVTVQVMSIVLTGTCGVPGPGQFATIPGDVSALPQSSFIRVFARTTDTAGNSASVIEVTGKATVGPVLWLGNLPPVTPFNFNGYFFDGNCIAGAGPVSFTITSTASVSGSVPCNDGVFVAELVDLSALAEGTITVQLSQANGGSPVTVTGSATKDMTNPILGLDIALPIANSNRQNYMAKGDCSGIGDPVAVTVGGVTFTTPFCGNGFGFFVLFGGNVTAVPDGTVQITATMTSGGRTATASTTTLKDATVVAPTITSPAEGATVSTTPLISGAGAEPFATITVRDNTTTTACTVNALHNGTWSCTPTLAPGVHLITARQMDSFGNTSGFTPSRIITVQGAVLAPAISVNPTTIDFGGQSLRTTSRDVELVVTNTGNAALAVGQVVTTGPFAAEHDCATVTAGATCTILVTFTPLTEGTSLGILTVTHNAAGGSTTVALGGTGELSLVTHFYGAILGRLPEPAGRASWENEAARLRALGANVNETWFAMALFFFNSAEYVSQNTTDLEFVADLYNTFFNRAGEPNGLAHWTGQLAAGMSRENVLLHFLFSPEFAGFTQAIFGNPPNRGEMDMVMDFYRGALGRLPDSGGFTYWLGLLRAAQCVGGGAIAAEVDTASAYFFNSPEYIGRGRSNTQYVNDLYDLFMRRGAEPGAAAYWAGEINAGRLSREDVRRFFLGSAEFQGRVARVAQETCLH